jgi:archaellum biogenesis ATPase FlaH
MLKLEKVTKDEIKGSINDAMERKYPSKFAFLNEHNGIRPSALSIMLGTSGGGKSTLIKSIVADSCKDHEVIVWLSEEEKSQYSIDLVRVDPNVNLDNIYFFEERKYREHIKSLRSTESIISSLMGMIREQKVGIVFFDNLTTSSFYDGRKPEVQADILAGLRDSAIKDNIALFCAAHVGKMTDGLTKMIRQDDIQGSSASTKTAQFFYILHLIDVGDKRQAYIELKKHRGFNPLCKFFKLLFKYGAYVSDERSSFESVNETWGMRNKLTEKKPEAKSGSSYKRY